MQALGGAKNHLVVIPDADIDQAVDALIGAAYGSAGERCMAISVAVAVTDAIGDALVERLAPRVTELKIGPGNQPGTQMGPLITREHRARVLDYINIGVEESAKLVVDGRGFPSPGVSPGFFCGWHVVRRRQTSHAHLQGGDFRSRARDLRVKNYREAVNLINANEFGNGTAVFTRDGDTAGRSRTRSRSVWSVSTCRSLFRWLSTASVVGRIHSLATTTFTDPRACAFTHG